MEKYLSTFGGGGGGPGNKPKPGGPGRPPVGDGPNDRPDAGGNKLGFLGRMARGAAKAVGRAGGIIRRGLSDGFRGGQAAR